VFTAISGEEGLEIMQKEDIALVITDQRMPRMTGIQFLQQIPENGDIIRMILTGYSDVEAVVEAINTGKVYRYITKPWSKDELKITLDNAIEAFKLRKANKRLIQELKEANEYLEQKVVERTAEVSTQKLEIENLLLNILPQEIAQELKLKGYATPRDYEHATVLFTDFVNFSAIAESLSPKELVAELNTFFMVFDGIIERYGLEKIKTIGDAYMCAGGIPIPTQTHPADAVRAGLAIQDYVQSENESKKARGNLPWSLRVGIHTGPVVAGVVGRKKFAYDIWGDAVNIASRMESCGEAGKVNISEHTYHFIKTQFFCLHRGKVSAKNKGEVDMYFVEREVSQ
jgi:class 3 adenylate cyclase/CheY-like chemotaxis protein